MEGNGAESDLELREATLDGLVEANSRKVGSGCGVSLVRPEARVKEDLGCVGEWG